MINFAAQTRSEDDRSLLGVVDRYDQRAQATGSYIDYSYHMIIVRDDPDVLQAELPVLMERGISSCKLFMTYETMRLQDKELLDVMMEARKVGMTTVRMQWAVKLYGAEATAHTRGEWGYDRVVDG